MTADGRNVTQQTMMARARPHMLLVSSCCAAHPRACRSRLPHTPTNNSFLLHLPQAPVHTPDDAPV
eukprot:1962846-Pleurochrysis_carterae.AAC.1